jgi:hypothetical protein
MKPVIRKTWLKHMAALLAGLALAMAWPGGDGEPVAEKSVPVDSSAGKGEGDFPGERKAKNSNRSDLKAEYAKAWEIMLRENNNTYQSKIQRESLLKDWADVDLKGALSAAMDFAKSSLGGSHWNPNCNHLGAFDEVIRRRPIEFFDVLKGDPFGLATGRARQHWISRVAVEEPGLIPGILDQLGNRDKVTALTRCLDSPNLDAGRRDALIFSLAALPDEPGNQALLDAAGKRLAELPESQLLERYEAASDEGSRRMIEAALHVRLLDDGEDRETMKKRLDSLPPQIAGAVLDRALNEPRQNSAAFTLALDRILDKPEWATREKELCMKLHNMFLRGANVGELAAWADTIPERQDCEDLHRVAMRGILGADREKAWSLLEEMPSGWKRDNGYVEYINRAIHVLSDESAALRAIERIESEHFKGQAGQMISVWREKQNN